jgi:hypothetical protein
VDVADVQQPDLSQVNRGERMAHERIETRLIAVVVAGAEVAAAVTVPLTRARSSVVAIAACLPDRFTMKATNGAAACRQRERRIRLRVSRS